MVAVLDQFEIETRGLYQSGSYDQVVMGQMYYYVNTGARKSLVFGNRGVVYGNLDNDVQPGTTVFDATKSESYRLQPYSEKSGNTRTAKFICQQEKIYDSLPPHAWQCFNANGANVFICDDYKEAPGYPQPPYPPEPGFESGLDFPGVGYIMFDHYVQNGPPGRENLNVGVDRHWTKSFPYEPRYSGINRQDSLKFLREDVYATYRLDFLSDIGFPSTAVPISPKKVRGAYLGITGPELIGQYLHSPGAVSAGSNWKHYWACDMQSYPEIPSAGEIPTVPAYTLTSSMETNDLAKVIYGFGDVNSKFLFSPQYGPDVLGTHNWPEFRVKLPTNPVPDPSPASYELVTASMWCVSPVIRGWKYGLYSGLPSYTSVHFRQGRYGQFRDMLEQRLFTKFFTAPDKIDSSDSAVIKKKMITEAPVTVQFIDQAGNVTNPENTQSQNLSYEATSSLPYFDGNQRNRSPGDSQTTNLEMVVFGVNSTGGVII